MSLFQAGGVLIGSGVGLVPKKGLNDNCGYTCSGAVGFLSSISELFNVLLVPSLLSRHQLASRLVVWFLSLFGVVLLFGKSLACGIMFSPVSNKSMCGSGPYVFLVFELLLDLVVGNSDEL